MGTAKHTNQDEKKGEEEIDRINRITRIKPDC